MNEELFNFSALHCPTRPGPPVPLEKTMLRGWNVEISKTTDEQSCFDADQGVYVAPVDGLYAIVVELIPIGTALAAHAQQRRVHVDYALRLQEPPQKGSLTHSADEIESEYIDIGSVTLGEMVHLKAGTSISCIRMPESAGAECVRLKIEMVQRKRKRPPAPELTKKQLKKRKMIKRKSESIASTSGSSFSVSPCMSRAFGDTSTALDASAGDDDDNDSYWSEGFESDRTEDNLPHSNRGVQRLAKRFKSGAGTDDMA